jgi:uncharacterized protein YjbK
MSREIEIEFKNLLTKQEFDLIKEKFSITSDLFKKQINYYFDSPTFDIKSLGGALRIREKNNSYTLTLKLKQSVGHLEIHQTLTEVLAKNMLNSNDIPTGEVKSYLEENGVSCQKLCLFGELATNRAELLYQEGLLVLDHSTYFHIDDYEIEYEVTDEKIGSEVFSNLLNQLQIPIRETPNKIKRFFTVKQQQIGEKIE